jgi:SAM-dependent MidA family methyltransferase
LRNGSPDLFAALRYRIVEPFPILRERQQDLLRGFAEQTEWCGSIEEMAPFSGVHFCNELIDAMPVHLLAAAGEPGRREWHERMVEWTSSGFVFVDRPIRDPRLQRQVRKIPPAPGGSYETEVNLAALDWIDALAGKLIRGVILVADYGFVRTDFYSPRHTTGTLQCYADHRVRSSPLEHVGETDITAHVEWTSLAEHAEECRLQIAGFTDQNHFLTGLLASYPELASAGAGESRALQTLIHPELLGKKFQFLGLTKNVGPDSSLGGFKFARDPRRALQLV